MHSLHHLGYAMHFNSDLSGTIKLEAPDGAIDIPGELLRMYVRKYVLGRLRDEFSDVMYRQIDEYGGKNSVDYAFLLEKIDRLEPISTEEDPTCVLHGTTYLFGSHVHITFLRVEKDDRGMWNTVDPAYREELDKLEAVADGDGPLNAIEVPGFAGNYIAYTYPFTE